MFDLHCHPGVFYAKGSSRYGGDEVVAKTIAEMNASGLSGAFFSTVSDAPILKRGENGITPARAFKPGEAWEEYRRQISILKKILPSMDVNLSTSVDDLDVMDKVSAFFSCEGGDFIEGLNRLDDVYADGVRCIQLVHYAPNHIGDLQTEASDHQGLSKLGKDVVSKMNQMGLLIDVAHASYDTVKDVAARSDSPIILSHSILKAEADRPIAARAISVDHAKMVAETGGVIGAWPSGFNRSFEDYVDNCLRLVDIVGVDHVGIGTDMDSNYKPVLNSYLQLSAWKDALAKKGLSKEEVNKLSGGNGVRVLKSVLIKS